MGAQGSTDVSDYADLRAELLRRPGPPGPGRRGALVALTDAWLAEVYAGAGGPASGAALVAVGGYGRGELAPGSDLDLLLLHRDRPVAGLADRLWYPVWDAGLALDHSVRTPAEARRLAARELTVLMGLLDARTVAGDPALAPALTASVLSDWRALAPRRLDELRAGVAERQERHGELAHLLEPDLKHSYGGLRDITTLRAVAASWVADLPHAVLGPPRDLLLDARDALHAVTGRSGDVLLQQEQGPVARVTGLGDPDVLLRRVCEAGRAVAYASDATWYRVERVTRARSRRSPRRVRRTPWPDRLPLADGVVVQDGEAVLAADARPDRDPVLALRAAAAAAQGGLRLSPYTVERLAVESAPLPDPWPREARDAFVALLGAGRATVAVWEALDAAGLVRRLLPGWDVVRSAPQRNPVHRFTVDRHLVETAVEASRLTRDVSRPDLLLVGALLHDIGKARGGDHVELGAQIVGGLGPRLGFDAADTAVLVAMARHHLLLPQVATRRDPDDPATVAAVVSAVGDHGLLDLLRALSFADAAATGPAAWSEWKRGLVEDLVARSHAALAGSPPPPPPTLTAAQEALAAGEGVQVLLEPDGPALALTVAAPDAPGLLAAVAGVLALHRLSVRAARTRSLSAGSGGVPGRAVTVWTVEPAYGEPPGLERLRDDLRRVLDGTLDVRGRLQRRAEAYVRRGAAAPPAARVVVVPDASDRATVLEVRVHDAPGLLHRVAGAIAGAGADITAARVATLGADVVDAFYLVRPGGERLGPGEAERVRAAVLAALAPAAPDASDGAAPEDPPAPGGA